jgi:peptide/nickel transport system substrate-binding protein
MEIRDLKSKHTIFFLILLISGFLFVVPAQIWAQDDITPPETFVDLYGVYHIDGYYMSDVKVYMWADDFMSGVEYTEYSFDNINWVEYFDPFIISGEGTHQLYYRSMDYEGNLEETKIENIIIQSRSEDDSTVIYGMRYLSYTIDPHDTWANDAYPVIDQVVETLYAYDLTDPEMKIIPRLASDYGVWTSDGLGYTIPLRTDVYFHDGTHFDANAVMWTFSRLAYLMNVTGELPLYSRRATVDSLYRWPDDTPIINHLEVIDPYTIKFMLNKPFGALDALLCFTGSGILSPTSTPENEFIDIFTDTLVGTGPFMYEVYVYGKGIKYKSYEDYWQGAPKIKDLWFITLDDPEILNNALLSGVIDFIQDPLISMMDQFQADPNIKVVANPGATTYYLCINNNLINKALRQSISYAINYSHIIDDAYADQMAESKSPVAQGIRYADWSYNAANFDVIHARQILVDNNICSYNVNEGDLWINAANNNPIATYTYADILSSPFSIDVGNLILDNLEKIGIKVIIDSMEWYEFLIRMLFEPDTIDLFYMGWIPDYNDPSTIVNLLLSNDRPTTNFVHADDPYLQDLINSAITETDQSIRRTIYSEMQRYLVEDLMPMVYLSVNINYDVYSSKFTGFQSNPLDKVWFYPVIPPEEPSIEVFDGFGIVYSQGQFLFGSAEFTVFEDILQLEIRGHIFMWEIIEQREVDNIMFYTGIGEQGRIRVIIVRTETASYVVASGEGIYFSGYS